LQLPGVVIATLLIASLLFVHLTVRARPLSDHRPLDVDAGLPLPEVGQASTVFSLTALFGAYFGIYIFLGLPALAGVACGTVLGLFVIRNWIQKHHSESFEDFLTSIFGGKTRNGDFFALGIGAAQCCYAASELLILREISRVALGMRADHATTLTVSMGIIGYFYVLFGGYLAVYRTDVVQFFLVAAMALVFGISLLFSSSMTITNIIIWPRPGYWDFPVVGPSASAWTYVYHFMIGAIMGLGLFAAAPDAWKRVFVVTKFRKKPAVRFLIFVLVGTAPFLALLPLGLVIPPIPDGPIDSRLMFSKFPAGSLVSLSVTLGMIACFLSSYNSALTASVHVGLILQRKRREVKIEIVRFHWLMVIALVSVFCLFYFFSFDNPYLLGNILLGPYAIIAAIQVGTRARPDDLPENSVLTLMISGFTAWFVYFVSVVGFPTGPTSLEVNTVPGGVAVFLTIVVICKTLVLFNKDRRT
jgi:Na+/proline symporter